MSEGQHPAGWKGCRLDDVAQVVRGITFPTTAKRFESADGLIACLRTTNVQATVEWGDLWFVPREYVKNDDQHVRNGDVLISTANSYELVGKVARVAPLVREASLGAFISLLRGERGINHAYFYYLMASEGTQSAIRGMASTTTNLSNVSSSKLKELPLAIAPTAEQARIVKKLEELLSELDAGVAELKAAQRKLAQYRQSLLKAAVEGALTADWRAARRTNAESPSSSFPRTRESSDLGAATALDSRVRGNDEQGLDAPLHETGAELLQRILTERRARWEAKQLVKFAEQGKAAPKDWQTKYPKPVTADITDLPALSEGWVWATLDQLTEFVTSGSRGWADYYADIGATFIRSQNINKDRLDLADIAFVNPPRNSEGARTRVQRDDLLLTITGANVGKSAWVDVDLDEAYVSQHVALIRPVDSRFSAYLHLFLTCKAGGRGQLDNQAYGAGKPGLNLQQVLSVAVPVPSADELPELLSAIASALDATEAQAAAVEHGLKQAAAQRKNILKAAFAGQLVAQDPNDEPASVLLERIRAERATRGPSEGKRSRKAKESSHA